ncbi:cell division protein ZapA [Pelagovum sp. HNIBRBA483]|uniref:cell division protein ZapA n=1 Tax=Pelagovum sp. HNIBRBA483 TaxID=3233341 RepID=UPI0034A185D8
MPQVAISIGGRVFEVACQEGEEPFLTAAAEMLDREASVLTAQVGRLPESQMLLMAGLMLADKTAALEDKVKGLEAKGETKVEVPVIPPHVTEMMAELAARAEAMAEALEEGDKA